MEHEPRITRLEPDAVEGDAREVFDQLIKLRGKVPNLFRIAAHRPPIMASLVRHMNAVMGAGEVDVLLKELATCRVSQINNCEY